MEKIIRRNYDSSDPTSIERYAKLLEGKTFLEVLSECIINSDDFNDAEARYGNSKRKGGLGNLLEEVYFGYKANSNQNADFEKAGVELKVTPYCLTRKNEYRAAERLVLGMIKYDSPVEMEFLKSSLWLKMQLMLLIYYFREVASPSNLHYKIVFVGLFSASAQDLEIIKSDYETINKKIAAGKAHELSGRDTLYLEACTKGKTARHSLRAQYYNPKVKAKSRAYALKQSYMNAVINSFAAANKAREESIIKDVTSLDNQSFEEIVIERITENQGKSIIELCHLYGLNFEEVKFKKDLRALIIYRILGIQNKKASEFSKANIKVKTVKLNSKGVNKEHISLNSFKFKEIICGKWEESSIYDYFDSTKFLFVVFQERDGESYLSHAKFWNMPTLDLSKHVKECWLSTRKIIEEGVAFICRGTQIFNNLPGSRDNPIMHIRPHASKSAYQLSDGTSKGNLERDADILPDGQKMTRQCFWLNKSYIHDIISDR